MKDFKMTVQGRVHRWSATPCQDAVAGAKHKGVTALALCDGAGSLPLSHAGASRLSEVFARWASARFYALLQQSDRAVAEEGAALIERTLAELASQYRAAPEAFGSTLLLVACDRYGKNLCMHLGDGLIVGMTNSGRQVLVSEPDGVRNATYLTCHSSRILRAHLRVCRPENIAGFFLSSDGSRKILYDQDADGVSASPEISRLLDKLYAGPAGFARGFTEFVERTVKPLDDWSVCMLVRDANEIAPTLGCPRGDPLRCRRVARSFARYIEALRLGLSRCRASQAAGWSRRDFRAKQARAEELIREEIGGGD